MKLIFFWTYFYRDKTKLYPSCRSVSENDSDDTKLLCTMLADDGGVGIDGTVSWMGELIGKIDAVKSGVASGKVSWSTEVMTVDVRKFGVKVYFEDDDAVYEQYNLDRFRNFIVEWINFIQSEPSSNAECLVEI